MLLRRVTGNSMLPTYESGSVVLAVGSFIREGDVVIAVQNGREVLKRVATIEKNNYHIRGDNMNQSTDSRHHGPVRRSDILGKVIMKLPAAVAPIKPRNEKAVYAGYVLGAVMLGFALLHLFRIDQLIPLLGDALSIGFGVAAFVTALVVIAEVFALPYLMMMRLSPLGHAVSGMLVLIVPLFWSLVSIWTLGSDISTGQLSKFAHIESNGWSVLLNLMWLAASYGLLWLRNYDKTWGRLRKAA